MKENDYVLVRTYSAGVHVGELVSKTTNQAGYFEVVLKNARRIYCWSGAATLSQLATEGTSNPKDCKFPCEVSEIHLSQGIEIIPVTAKARESISGVRIWAM